MHVAEVGVAVVVGPQVAVGAVAAAAAVAELADLPTTIELWDQPNW